MFPEAVEGSKVITSNF